MNEVADFFSKLFDSADWPPRWHCGKWTEFHGWLYIISDVLIWTAYFTIPLIIIKYVTRKQGANFIKLYFLFAAFILACGSTHFLDALSFWLPVYRLNALVRLMTGILSWVTVYYLIRFVPLAFSLKTTTEFEAEIAQKMKAEKEARESEEQLQIIFNSAPDAVIIINDEGSVTKWNPKAEELFGWSSNEAIGRSFSSLVIPGKDRGDILHLTSEASELTEIHPAKTIELRAMRQNLTEFDIALSISPTSLNNQPLFICFARDITRQKRAAAEINHLNNTLEQRVAERTMALMHSETKYRELFENNPIPSWVVKLPSLEFIAVNKAAVNSYGYTRQEFLSKSAPDIQPGYEEEYFSNLNGTAASEAKTETIIRKHLKKDGEYIHAEVAENDIIFEGAPALLVLSNDITNRIKAEEKLARIVKDISDYKYALDESSIVAITNQKGIINYVNDNFCAISKYIREELLGQDHRIINTSLHTAEFIGNLWATIAGGDIWKGELMNKAKDGIIYWVDTTIVPFLGDDGKPYQYVAISSDITEKKKLEEQKAFFMSLVNSSNDAIISKDLDGIITTWNKGAESVFGYSSVEIIGRPVSLIIPPDLQNDERDIAEKIAAGESIVHYETTRIRKDGERIHVSLSVSPIKDSAGNIIGASKISRDITNQKLIEGKLINSEEQLRQTLDNLVGGAQIHDYNWRYTYVNDTLAKYSKQTKEELLGYTIMEKFPGIEDTRLFKVMERSMIERTNQELETEFNFPDGSVGYFQVSIQPVPQGLFILSMDISQRKIAERDAIKANKDKESVLNRISDGVVSFDKEWHYTFLNNAASIITSEDGSDPLGKLLWEVNPAIKETVFWQKYNEAMRSGKVVEFESFYASRNVWYFVSVYPSADGLTIFYKNVTESRKQEREMLNILKEVKDYKFALDEASIVSITDQKGIIKYVNNNFCEISGYTQEELIGKDHRIVNSGYHDKQFIRSLWVNIANGRIWRGELKNSAKDGSIYWVDTTIVPFLDENGKPYQYVAIRADITQAKMIENEIRVLNEELEKRVKERTEELESFSYSVSHDLRAPLRAVHGYASILDEDYHHVFDDEGRRLLKKVQDNATRMGVLIDDLLTFSRLGRKEVEKSLIDMDQLAKLVAKEIHQVTPYHADIKFANLQPVLADHALIEQVMVNLLSNAIKYSGNNPNPEIVISSKLENNQLVYSVSDNGVGFDMRYIHKLFGVFQRLHSAEEFPGTGVGLAIVQRIIHKHNGKIWAEGELDKGATFHFSLPVN
ncbi:MAG: PAS domain S-box protein [Ferruginibacter sp.]